MRLGKRVLLFCCAGLALVTVQPAFAAQIVQPVPGTTRTYLLSDFTRFSPRTALDIVRLVPGFIIFDAEERRGLGGNEANLLIDGRPVRGKITDTVDALSRITADRVSRVEVSGMPSSETTGVTGQVVNIVLANAALVRTGQFTWRPATRLRDLDASLLGGNVSINGSAGRLEYSIGLRNEASRTGASGPTRIFDAEGHITEFRDDIFVERSDRPRLGADLRYKGLGDASFGLRASYQQFFYRFRERSDRIFLNDDDRTRFLTQSIRTRRFEIAGDSEFGLGPGKLKLIGLYTAERGPVDTTVTTEFGEDDPSTGERFVRDGNERAAIARSEYRWTAGRTDWLVSAERALTRLDNVSSLFSVLPDGSSIEQQLSGGSGNVRELRHEAALNVTHRLSRRLTVQGSIGGEISSLRLVGDVGTGRRFRRPKGFVALAWRANPKLSITGRIERKIGQISFFDFLASRNLSDDQANLSNPDLVPPQLWSAEAEITRDLGSLGSTTVKVYGQRIQDLVELVPIGATGEAPGNLSAAHLYGLDWKSSLFLDRLGLAGVRADARLQFQKSSVEDPVTGRSRRISNNLVRLVDVSVRHDLPGTKWAYGAGLFHRRRAPNFRVSEVGQFREGPLSGNVFVEHKDVAGLTVRAGLSNLLNSRQELDRSLFTPRRDGQLLSVERRRRSVGPILSLVVSGNF